uniref:NADH dehydrogenase subunit 2 n=1 Tax=Pterocladiella musciformis TaxID=2699131 RepID=A0A1D8X7U2_9FLOR|nr:NADH dehydrogenase subunit 2 [Pterocladiella musciformis]AOX49090.1 NADH dehydrogenase subunit 2 [Pterocladiella musciformis]
MDYLLYNLYSIASEAYILWVVNILLIYGVFFSSSFTLGFPILNKSTCWLSLQSLIFALILMLNQEQINIVSWNNFLILNDFTYSAKIIILSFGISWVFLSYEHSFQYKLNAFEFWILILLSITAMLFVTQAYDLLSIYLTVEFQSLVFYILASFNRTSEFSTEAGLKYFILGAFSSALLLFGSSLLYGLTGLTNLNDFANLFTGFEVIDSSTALGIITGIIFIISALFFKISASPFHMWAPDVYEGANIIVTALFSILPKLPVVSILLKLLFFSFHDLIDYWSIFIMISAILSLLVGALGAFMQLKWKRFMAYSSINHVGFILLALITGSNEAIFSFIVYILIYMITIVGTFNFIMSLRIFYYPKIQQSRYLENLTMLSVTNPLLAASMTIFLFSMAGIPPLAGFFSKLFILITIIKNNIIGVSIIAVLINCIACFYYIRLIKKMYFDYKSYWPVLIPVTKINSLLLGLALIIIVFLVIDLELVSIIATFMLS